MNFCPLYTNKEIFDGFNEIIESLGGKPMTEEEFRSGELRNLRTGRDYSAMEAAYTVYDRNGGNFLDKTPTGEDSILFLTLLDYFEGDRKKAIVAKSNVYSDEFFNWFGDWTGNANSEQFDEETRKQISLIFKRIPKLSEIGTEELYAKYIQTIFPESKDKSIYWHGSNSDFSEGFKSAKRGDGSGAPETKKRNDFYLAKQAWAVLQYVNGVNRKSVDKNGFSHWNKLWWEFKEIMSNGRRLNNDWKDLVINEENVRQAIPNKKGIFNRDKGGNNGKWLKERKADYGYENKSDKEFFEEILGVKWGEDTFNTWTKRNKEIFKSLQETEKGIYPAVINTQNPIRESGQNTYYEEDRGLFTQADANNNDAILSSNADNEFNSDVAVVLRDNNRVYFLGTEDDIKSFKEFVTGQLVSKVVDANGEPLVVWHGTVLQEFYFKDGNPYTRNVPKFDTFKSGFFTDDYNAALTFANGNTSKMYMVYLSIKNPGVVDAKGNDFESVPYKAENKRTDYIVYDINNNGLNDGTIILNVSGENWGRVKNTIDDYIPAAPNQIKHVENLGTWNPNNPNMYNIRITKKDAADFLNISNQTQLSSETNVFGEITFSQLLQGSVSSDQILSSIIESGSISTYNLLLAKILQKHNIPVRLGVLEDGVVASTIFDNIEGSVIVINKNWIGKTTSSFLGDAILHEIVHSLTLPAIINPTTQEERSFAASNNKTFDVFKKLLPKYVLEGSDIGLNGYILENQQEFAAVFATNKGARAYLYEMAKRADKDNSKKLLLILKNFVNKLTKFLINKTVFDTNLQTLLKYEETLKNYLYNRAYIKNGNIKNKELFDLVYNNYDIDNFNLNKRTRTANQVNSLLDILHRNNIITQQKDKLFENIAQVLFTRLKTIRNSSVQNESIIKLTQIIEYQADQITKASYAERLIGLLAIAANLSPQVEDILKTVQEKIKNGSISSTEYRLYKHVDIGSFAKISKDCSAILTDEDFLNELAQALYDAKPDKKDVTTPDGAVDFNKFKKSLIENSINPLITVFNDISNCCRQVDDMLANLLTTSIAPNTLLKVFDAVKNPTAEEYLLHMSEVEEDGSLFTRLKLSPLDYEQDDALRSIAYLVRKANKDADNETYDQIIPLLEDLENLNGSISLDDFYEVKLVKDDKTGKIKRITTGYLVRPFNFGQFYDDYLEEMTRINRHINKKYKLNLLDTNRTAPDDDAARQEFNDMRNKWLEENSIRRFTNEYYRALSELPTEAIRQMLSINLQIFQINSLPNVTKDGSTHPDYYQLTPEQWDTLQELIIRKKMLRSDYDEWGNLKTPSELKTARAILKYYSILYGDDKKGFKKDIDAWEKARNEFLISLGATGFYNESRHYFDEAGIKTFMESHQEENKKWKLWNERNSRQLFKQDEDGNALVFKQIENELAKAKPNYGEEDDKLSEKINQMMRVFYGTNGHVHDLFMSKSILKKLIALMVKQARLRHKLRKKNPGLNSLAEEYGTILNKYIVFEETERFKQIKQLIFEKASKYGMDDGGLYFYNLMKEYARIKYADFEMSMPVGYKPFAWFTKIKAKDEERWMEWVPGDSFSDLENSAKYKNAEFKEEYNVSYIPKGKKYDNSKLYNKVKDTKLYEHVINAMEAAYGNMKNRSHADPYLLPLITGSLLKRLSAHAGFMGKVDGTWLWVKDNVGLNGITQDDFEYGMNDADLSDDSPVDETISDKMNRIGTLSNMPDNSVSHIIPQFYTKRKRPEYISKDLIGIISTFYNMSARYKYKMDIKDDCETILEMLENRTYKNKKLFSRNVESVSGSQTNIYNAGRTFLDMNLYGIRRKKGEVNVSPTLNWEFTKTIDLLKRYTTANNLGANPKVALVGFMTTYYGHLINALCGNGYSFGDAKYGAKVVSLYIIDNVVTGAVTLGYNTDIGKSLSDRTLVLLMEKFNLSNQFNRKVQHTNWSRVLKAVYENSIYGLLSSADFLSKSTILVSVMHAFRLVDGEFVNKDMIYRNSVKLPEDLREDYINSKLEIYNNADTKTMYDVVSVKDKKLNIDSKYKTAFDNAFYVVQATAEKLAERADGMATEEQKAAITQNVLGSLILIHRQYLPLQWTERFTKPVYDFDMQMYKGGLFNLIYKYIKTFAMQSTRNAVFTGLALGWFVGSPIIGTTLGLGIGLLTKQSHQNKSLKEINQEFFNDFSTEDKSLRSMHNKKLKKQIFWEILVCKSIAFLVYLLCKLADEPDKKDDKLLLFMALSARLFEWEAYTPYRPDDTLAAFKTVSPSTGTFDDILNGLSLFENYSNHLIGGYLMPSRTATNPFGILLDTFSFGNEKDIFREMRSGPYKGDTQAFKIFAKLFPWSNTYEQWADSKGKRKYLENQIMKVNK